jgi:hypothetical protein
VEEGALLSWRVSKLPGSRPNKLRLGPVGTSKKVEKSVASQ